MHNISIILCVVFLISCRGNKEQEKKSSAETQPNIITDYWQWKTFVKIDSVNPVLVPNPKSIFYCPVRKENVHWEEKDVFNPAAVVRDDKIYMIYRAEDSIGKFMGTSRLGLAVSDDGFHFSRRHEPVFYPENDLMNIYEWEGGCEDPRIVESPDGKYIMTYTSYDGKTARLCLASSHDLINWSKHGLALGTAYHGKYRDLWSKSGSIICYQTGNKLIASKINGNYWMYWGDTHIYAAKSEDLIKWAPVENEDGSLKIVFSPRKGYFDSELVEPGPPAVITPDGIWMIYNSRNHAEWGDPSLPVGTYAAGQILFDQNDPLKIMARCETYFFRPENAYEITGQVGNVCFLEALVPFNGKWYLYYGTADSKIAVAVL